MRIGIDITKALPPRDGLGHYTAELVRAVSSQTDDADEIRLYSLDPSLDPGAFQVSPNPPWQDELDVFHCTSWAWPAAFTGPTVFTCYDLTVLSHPACHTLHNRILSLTGTLEAHLSDAAFVAISQATASELETRLGVPSSRVRVIYPAAAEVFRRIPSEEAARRVNERFGLDGEFVLAVGTLEPRKNLARLAAAHGGLPEELRRRFPLVLAGGEGWKLDDGELRAARRLGYVDRDDLVALYNAATVFAYPSLAEGFGLPVVEAMACGAPVLTSNASSLGEVAGGAACLVNPLDTDDIRRHLHEILKSPAERERLHELGRQRAAVFSWEKAGRQTLDLYRELTSR